LRRGTILVGHGQLPKDIPSDVRSEYYRLRFKKVKTPDEEKRYKELNETILSWPRNPITTLTVIMSMNWHH